MRGEVQETLRPDTPRLIRLLPGFIPAASTTSSQAVIDVKPESGQLHVKMAPTVTSAKVRRTTGGEGGILTPQAPSLPPLQEETELASILADLTMGRGKPTRTRRAEPRRAPARRRRRVREWAEEAPLPGLAQTDTSRGRPLVLLLHLPCPCRRQEGGQGRGGRGEGSRRAPAPSCMAASPLRPSLPCRRHRLQQLEEAEGTRQTRRREKRAGQQ